MPRTRALFWAHRTATALIGLTMVGLSQAQSGGVLLRGFVNEETLPGLFTFRRCQASQVNPRAFLLNDKSTNQQLFAAIVEVRKSRSDADQPLLVEFRGALSDKYVDAQSLVRVVGYAGSCDEVPALPAATVLYAEGRDPTWQLVATTAGARFEILGRPPVRFPAAPFRTPQRVDSVNVVDAWSRDDGGSIRVEIRRELCIDSGAETAYGARVRVRMGSTEFEGCGIAP